MSEAAGARVAQAELGPATQLIALYADGSDEAVVAAGKLTLGMIAETATWFDGKGDTQGPLCAERVRLWWLNQVRIADGEDAEELEERWAIAFAKAKGTKPEPEAATPTKTHAKIKAEIEAKRAKAATAISEASAKADAELAEAEAKPEQLELKFEEREKSKPQAAPVLSKQVPMENARAFARDRLSRDGMLATYHYRGDWWQWNGRFYERAPGDRIIGAVYQYLDKAKVWTANGEEPFRPKPEQAEALIKCLKACVAIDDREIPPAWLGEDGARRAESLLVFGNCLVDADTGEIVGLTPKLWAHSGVDFDYDAKARCPRWEGDPESQATLEEQLGYGMTNDVRFEKGALWVGEKRSGKSTLVWIQEQLVGSAAYASLSFHDWTKTENSRAHLVGKKVAVFPDVRLKPPKNFGLTGYDPGGLDHQSAQILLQIIGRDTVAIGRKNEEAWQGRLSTKIIITTNELLNLQDAGGVLITRFIMLEFKQSFFGREDVNLREKLEAELPGIANRCLTAYRRLRERGRFIQPKAGLGLLQRIEEKIDPYVADSDEVARAFRDDVARDSDMMSPMAWCLAGG